MTKKLARVALTGVAAALLVTPTMASSAVRCLVMIDSPWGEICLVPDVFS